MKTAKFEADGNGTCPMCDQTFAMNSSPPYRSSFTTDCHNCGGLMLVEGDTVYPFHEKLNSEDSRWPKDGKGTGSLTIGE